MITASKADYYSGWNVDQMAMSGEITMTVNPGDTAVVNYSSLGLGFIPKYIVAAKQAGATTWEQSGNRLRASIDSTTLYVNSQVTPSTQWTIRYYILNTPILP